MITANEARKIFETHKAEEEAKYQKKVREFAEALETRIIQEAKNGRTNFHQFFENLPCREVDDVAEVLREYGYTVNSQNRWLDVNW